MGCNTLVKGEKLASVAFVLPNEYEEIVYKSRSNCRAFKNIGARTSVEGDFDGDGIKDSAKLVRRKAEEQEYLYVWLSSLNFKGIELDEIGPKEARNNMAISLGLRGTSMQDACATGYIELCEETGAKEVNFKNDYLWYAQCEARASVFYWEPSTKAFKRIW